MSYTPFPVQRFGGLNLEVDPQEIGAEGAADLLNVDFDRLGRLRSRDGFEQFNTTTLASNFYDSPIFSGTVNGAQLLAVRVKSGTTLALDTFGDNGGATEQATFTASADAVMMDSANIGSNTSSLVYFTVHDPSAGFTLRKYNGSTVATGTGKPVFVETFRDRARLMQGYYVAAADSPSGANGSTSVVFFSDPGAPDTYDSTNWVALRPGDGEGLTGLATWSHVSFAFKETVAFFFYGESIDATGSPVFNFESINLPAPIVPTSPGSSARRVVVGDDGVYFVTRGGIFRTDRNTPQLVSGPIQSVFSSDSSVSSSLRILPGTSMDLSWCDGRLYAAYFTAASSFRVLVWDSRTNVWTAWGPIGGKFYTTFPPGAVSIATHEAVFFASGTDVYRMAPNLTTDDGTAIDWHYTSGAYELAEGLEVVTRYSSLWGSGSPSVALLLDRASSDANAGAVTLGTAPAVAEGQHRKSYRGVQWQHKLSGSGAATVDKLTHWITNVRLPGMRSG